jgi:hypothetical protein
MTLTHAPRHVSSRAVTGQPPPSRPGGAAAPRRTAFWLLAVVLLAALGLFSVSRFARGAR